MIRFAQCFVSPDDDLFRSTIRFAQFFFWLDDVSFRAMVFLSQQSDFYTMRMTICDKYLSDKKRKRA